MPKSDLDRIDAHRITPEEYEELPELTDDMLKRGTIKRAGRPVATDPRRQVTIRLPASVLAVWKATGPGWQTRMAEVLSKYATDKRLARVRKLRESLGAAASFDTLDIDEMKREGRP